ncbi:MAG: glycosyltransferase [Chloroflexi bacterium]|nr:glycosyltransferase [Chloroflexota bacterium]
MTVITPPAADDPTPTVSVVIVNFNGREHLAECLPSLFALDYPSDRVQIIVVDNKSTDKAARWLSETYPTVRVIVNQENVGFGRGISAGVSVATGEWLAFLNPDMRADSRWLAELVATAQSGPDVACAGSIVLSWDGDKVDYGGRPGDALNLFPAEPADARTLFAAPDDAPFLFASGGAMLIRREVFDAAGGFDPDFFLYHEDVDLGWRLWSRGYRVLRCLRSRVYHKPGSSSRQFTIEQLALWSEENVLATAIKNLDDSQFHAILTPLVYFLVSRSRWWQVTRTTIPRAIVKCIDEVDALWTKREAIQRARSRVDFDIFDQVGHPFRALLDDSECIEFVSRIAADSEQIRPPATADALRRYLIDLALKAGQFSAGLAHDRMTLTQTRVQSLSAELAEQAISAQALAAQLAAERDRAAALGAEAKDERQRAVEFFAQLEIAMKDEMALAQQIRDERDRALALDAELKEERERVADLSAQLALARKRETAFDRQFRDQRERSASLAAELLDNKREFQSVSQQLAEQSQRASRLDLILNTIYGSKLWKVGTFYRRILEGTFELLKLRRRQTFTGSPVEAVVASPAILGDSAELEAAATNPGEVDLGCSDKIDAICFPVIDWRFRFQRPQQLLTRFARDGHRVLYVRTTLSGQERIRADIRPLERNIYEIALPGPARLSIYRDELDEPSLHASFGALQALIRDQAIAEAICIVHHPFWMPLVRALKQTYGWKILYDCMDDHSGFKPTPPAVLEREAELLGLSDLAVASAHVLLERVSAVQPNSFLLPNAGDYEHFSALPQRASSPLAYLRAPVVGYYGAIAEWFDVDAIRALALRHPNWSIALIGHTFGADLDKLAGLGNVHLLGEKSYADLPAYLAGFDVCTIPFRCTTLTQATHPVKVFEYLAAGKPVVARDLPELQPLADLVDLYSTPEEFVTRTERALKKNSAASVKRRQAYAGANTWDVRYASLKPRVQALYGKACIVVVTWNNVDLTRQCLESVLRDHTYPQFQVIVVDNASTDETPAYLTALAEREPRVRIVLNEKNLGFAAANNVALRRVQDCEFVVFLNNDTVVPRGWLARLLRHARKSDIGLVGPATNWAGNEAMIDVTYRDLKDMEPFARRYVAEHEDQIFDIKSLALFCVAMRAQVIKAVGALDERFGIGMFEDDDYARRVRQAGLRVVCADDVFVHHRGNASFSKLSSLEYSSLFDLNKRLFEEKWGEPWIPHRSRPASTSDTASKEETA